LIDDAPSDDYLLGMLPLEVCLLGDRAARGGRGRLYRYPWLEKQHQQYGDHRWFDVTLIERFVLYDLSNVYFGMLVQNHHPILFDIWIRSIRLNFIASN
jgi:hypothetical protein